MGVSLEPRARIPWLPDLVFVKKAIRGRSNLLPLLSLPVYRRRCFIQSSEHITVRLVCTTVTLGGTTSTFFILITK